LEVKKINPILTIHFFCDFDVKFFRLLLFNGVLESKCISGSFIMFEQTKPEKVYINFGFENHCIEVSITHVEIITCFKVAETLPLYYFERTR